MKKRLITGILLVMFLFPLVSVDALFIPLNIVMLFFVIVGTNEMIRLFSKEHQFSKFAQGVIYLSSIAVYFSGLAWGAGMGVDNDLKLIFTIRPTISYVLLLISVLSLLSLLVLDREFDGRSIGQAVVTAFYIGMGCSSIMILRLMGVRFITYLFLVTMMTDIFAYLFGMKFGAHKMIPHISPKKSWEGAIFGSIIATTIASVFAASYGNLFQDQHENILSIFGFAEHLGRGAEIAIIIGMTLLATMFSQIGDLVASRLKRTYQIKDFGNIFPGHGGVLDRFDSALFTAMFLLAVFLVFQTVTDIVAAIQFVVL